MTCNNCGGPADPDELVTHFAEQMQLQVPKEWPFIIVMKAGDKIFCASSIKERDTATDLIRRTLGKMETGENLAEEKSE